ncbi:putative ribonuclease H-like domain-containing protein [Tanacetum coccineum]
MVLQKGKNRTLIEAAKTMLADSLLPIPFWAEAVNIVCYVLNRVLVTKPQNKTPYELLIGKLPSISFMRPFGCPLTILNTLDSLGKFDGKSDEGYLLGYSTTSSLEKDKEPTQEYMLLPLHPHRPRISIEGVVQAAQEKPSENFPVSVENQVNVDASTQEHYVAGSLEKDKEPTQEYILLPLNLHRPRISVEGVVQAAQEKPSEIFPKDNDVQDSEDVAEKYMMLQDKPLKKKRRGQLRLPVHLKRRKLGYKSSVSTANTPYVSAASTSTAYDVKMLGAWPDFNNMDKLCYRHFSHTQIHKVFKRTNSRRSLHLQFKQEENPKASSALLSLEELRDYITSLSSESWVEAMQENCLVQIQKEEGIDYDEVFDLLPELRQLVYSDQALYGLLSSSSAWYETLLLSVGKMVSEEQQPDGIFISQDKYVADILKKFDFLSIRTATTPIESNKSLVKDEDGVDVDVHVYSSMIGSLMFVDCFRPDFMFAVLDLPFELEAYSDSDYGGASLDRKSTTGGCQFLGRRLISWQCKKQTIVANSTTEAEYVAAANCCGQVLWIQNQMMDYGFNFMNTKIHIDNESTISVIKNPVAHSRTKHSEILFRF